MAVLGEGPLDRLGAAAPVGLRLGVVVQGDHPQHDAARVRLGPLDVEHDLAAVLVTQLGEEGAALVGVGELGVDEAVEGGLGQHLRHLVGQTDPDLRGELAQAGPLDGVAQLRLEHRRLLLADPLQGLRGAGLVPGPPQRRTGQPAKFGEPAARPVVDVEHDTRDLALVGPQHRPLGVLLDQQLHQRHCLHRGRLPRPAGQVLLLDLHPQLAERVVAVLGDSQRRVVAAEFVVAAGLRQPGQDRRQLTRRVPLVRQGFGDQRRHRVRVREPGAGQLLGQGPVLGQLVDSLRQLGALRDPFAAFRGECGRHGPLLGVECRPGLGAQLAHPVRQTPLQVGGLLLEALVGLGLQGAGLLAEPLDALLAALLPAPQVREAALHVDPGLPAHVLHQLREVAADLPQLLGAAQQPVPGRLVHLDALPTAHVPFPSMALRLSRVLTASTAASKASSSPGGGTPTSRADGPSRAISALRGRSSKSYSSSPPRS